MQILHETVYHERYSVHLVQRPRSSKLMPDLPWLSVFEESTDEMRKERRRALAMLVAYADQVRILFLAFLLLTYLVAVGRKKASSSSSLGKTFFPTTFFSGY